MRLWCEPLAGIRLPAVVQLSLQLHGLRSEWSGSGGRSPALLKPSPVTNPQGGEGEGETHFYTLSQNYASLGRLTSSQREVYLYLRFDFDGFPV